MSEFIQKMAKEFEGADLARFNELVTKYSSDISAFYDVTDWANGGYQDDDTDTLFVALDGFGEYTSAVYSFKRVKEILSTLGSSLKDVAPDLLAYLRNADESGFALELRDAMRLSKSGDVRSAGIYSRGGMTLFAVYCKG